METSKNKAVARYLRKISARMSRLEDGLKFVEGIEPRLASLEASDVVTEEGAQEVRVVDRDVQARLLALESRLDLLEGENQALAYACAVLRDQNEAVMNLYAAEHRLRGTRTKEAVIELVNEVLADYLGAEEFTILVLGGDGEGLERVAGRGDDHLADDVPLGARLLKMVAQNGKPFYYESSSEASRRCAMPLVAIPVKKAGTPVGVLAVYRMRSKKNGLTPVDHHLMELVAESVASVLHDATAPELDLKGA